MYKSFLSLAFFFALIYACKSKSEPLTPVLHLEASLAVDGVQRTYLLNLPPNFNEGSNFSLVVAMHGGGGNPMQFERTSKLSEKANQAGFVVVYPQGVGFIPTWNAGLCCGNAMNTGVDDVKFISNLIDYLVANYKINPKKVYATGHSNGGMMSYRLACELSQKIAAIAPNASTMVVSQPCNPSRPVPILHLHSKLDEHVPYQGGVGNGVTGINCPAVADVLQSWANKNGCTNTNPVVSIKTNYTLTQWNTCNKSSIVYYLTNDGGHSWPGGLAGSLIGDTPAQSINANDLIWYFFQQYSLP